MQKHLWVFLTVLFLLIVWPCPANGEEFRVETPAALQSAAESAQPGDVITIVGADWHDVELKLTLTGTPEKPITVRSQVAWTGESSLRLQGAYGVLDGFSFKNGSLKSGHVIRVDGSHHRVTRCTIENYNPAEIDVRYPWLSLYGHHHRVDHCRLAGKNH